MPRPNKNDAKAARDQRGERQGNNFKTMLRVRQGYTWQANTKQPPHKSAYSWVPPNQGVESPSVKQRALNTDETSHPHALVHLYHMVPTLLAEQTKHERHHGAERTPNMTKSQRNNKSLSNTRQRDMAQNFVSRTHHDTTSNYATPHDNAKNHVPRHNTHPNATQHQSKQHNTTQHNAATSAPPQHNGRAMPYHTRSHKTTALHDTTMERNQHTYYTTPRNAERQLKTTSPPTRYTTPKQTTKQRYVITQHNMLHKTTNRQVTTHNTA